MKKYQFEVCANSVESCLAAQAGGANRVELCAGIPEGGTTPSYGEISTARDMLTTTRLHIIIRPRGGDFLYSPIEVRTMLKDIEMARSGIRLSDGKRGNRPSCNARVNESLTRVISDFSPCL